MTDPRNDEMTRGAQDAHSAAELRTPPAVAKVRDEDLEPHAGLRYIARLFKGLAILITFMLLAEIVIGLQQDGTAAIGLLLVQATRLIVFAGMLWGAGDLALMLIESNHDLRATRILLGRANNKLELLAAAATPRPVTPAGAGDDPAMHVRRADGAPAGAPPAERRSGPR